MAHLKEQSLGRALVCLLPVRRERSIFNDYFCKSTSQCREFSASPVKGLTAHPPDTNTKVFDPKPGTERLEQIYLLNHCNLKTNFKKPLIVATLN